MNSIKVLFIFSLIASYSLGIKVYAQERLTISKIVSKLEKSNEYKIQAENIKESKFIESAVDGMLDGKISSKLFKYSSSNYPNPPISLDSQREGYGLSVDYEKMSSYGFKFGLGVGFEDRNFATIPSNSQFSLNAMDSVYRASIVVPLWRNFGSREYYLKKMTASKQRDSIEFKSKNEKDKLVSESVSLYWSIVKLMQEKDIAENSLSRFKSLHKLNLVKMKSGIISKAEMLTSEVEIKNRQKNLKDLIAKIDIEKIRLKTLIEEDNLPPVSVEKMGFSNKLLTMTDAEVAVLIETGLVQSQVQSSKELFENLLKVEREATKANLDLFVSAKSFGRGQDFYESIDENSQAKYEIYAGINWSFDLNSSKNSSNLGRALSQKRQAVLREKQTNLKLRNGFSEIRKKIKSNLEQISYLEKIRNQQQEILTTEKKRFQNGKISTLDYVKLQESYDRSSLQIIALKYFNEIIALRLFSTVGRFDVYLSNYIKGISL